MANRFRSERKREKLVQDILGGIIIFVCLLGFGWWTATEYNSNYQQVQGIAANTINERCGEHVVYPEDIDIDEGTRVWYAMAPIRPHYDRYTGELTCKQSEKKVLWTVNR